MKKYKYESHMHTWPVSQCGKAAVQEALTFYKAIGYDGVFITNHFIGGNINYDHNAPYEEQLDFFLTDYYEGLKIGKEIGIKVFFGVELAQLFPNGHWGGTDFLVYGLKPSWYREHPEIVTLEKPQALDIIREAGGLVIQAHPYRKDSYIEWIRLYPWNIDGAEVLNASRPDFESRMGLAFAEAYGLLKTAGSDNHKAGRVEWLGCMSTDEPLCSEADFVKAVREGICDLDKIRNPRLSDPSIRI